ncbi:MAG: thiamine pyrophosphate-dependent enzyme, partial [Xanthobacteraceae bacterium]
EAPQVMAHAFQAMTSGRPGPVAVEMPWDMFPATAEVTPVEPLGKRVPPLPDAEKITALAKLVNAAKAPMIWVGGGAVGAGPEILELVEKIGAPVVSFRTGKGVVDSRHPLSLNTVSGFHLWDRTDLLIGIGTRLDVPTARWAPAPVGLKLARIDIDPAEHRRLPVNVAVVADAAEGTRALVDAVERRDNPSWGKAVAAAKAAALAQLQKAQPQYSMVEAIRDVLPDDGIVVDEVTQMGFAARLALPVYKPRTFLSPGYQDNLGWGFATALGVQDARRDTPVVSISGDGGFMYTANELSTAMRHRIPLVTIVFADGAFGNVRRTQEERYGNRLIACDLANPDFVRFAESFGAAAERVRDPDALRAALKRGFARRDGPTLIEMPVGPMPSPWEFIHMPRVRGD